MATSVTDSLPQYLASLTPKEAAAWIVDATPEQLAELDGYADVKPADNYARHKERMRTRTAQASASGRDIYPLPAVANKRRRNQGIKSFRKFADTYFPETFTLAWSPDHLKAISKIEKAVLSGGLFALAMPRGSGKTTLCETACIWAVLSGHRKFVVLIGASEDAAGQMLDSIKREIETNELLAADFPEVTYPVSRLGGIVNRANGQLYQGKRTFITWTAREIVLPTITGSASSGSIVRTAGITGRVRGLKSKTADGEAIRPDLVIVDDPQTDESARSPSQCRTREQVLSAAILNLCGPGKTMAGVMPCTVIRPDDMADNILDREKHPLWQGERTCLVYAWPDNANLWAEYGELRADEMRADGDGSQATEFYKERRNEMDKGAIVAWPERYNPNELSAIQHAYNLRFRDEAAFFAEYQNEPVPLEEEAELLTPDEISKKINGLKRYELTQDVERLTAFVDIQKNILFYTVVAWSPTFTGYVVDYGTYPEQKLKYFTLREVTRTLKRSKPGAGLEGAIYDGLTNVTDKILSKVYTRDDGAELVTDLMLIDANWGLTTDLVHAFCRQTDYRGKVMPAHGRYVGASSKPFSDYRNVKGDRAGKNWRIPGVKGKRQVRHVLFDSNYWKSFIHSRLSQAIGDSGAVSFWKAKPATHRMISDHMHGEYRVRTEGRGRVVDEWKLKPNKPDNHYFDCLAGSAVAASVVGCELIAVGANNTINSQGSRRRPKASVKF